MENSNTLFEKLGEILRPEPALLQHLERKAVQAHNWTSFSPERRGEQMIKDYSEELAGDQQELREANVEELNIAEYSARYERFFSSYLSAKSNCFSVMITGGSGFNNRKHAKANRSEQRHYEIFREWRGRAKKAIIRKAQPKKTFVSELDRYRSELESMKANHELMKQGNKRIKEAGKKGEDITGYLTQTFGIAPHMIEHTMRWGFGLTNNNANIKRVELRIKELEQKESLREENPITTYKFEGGELVVNYEIDRLQIIFDSKPTQSELSDWKVKGLSSYNWSPSNTAWQRKITANALWQVKRMLPQLTKI
jgi:hypothetical protein